MPKRPGYALFIDRIKREGRYDAWKRHYDRFKEEGQSIKKATYNACLKLGYEGSEAEHKIHDEYVIDQGYQEDREWHRKEIAANDKEEHDIAVVKVLEDYDISQSDLPEQIAWVYHNMHKCKGEPTEWFVTANQAPSPGAWSMLEWAVSNKTKFMDSVIKEQMKVNASKTEDEGMKAIEKSVDDLDEMIRAIRREKEYEQA